MRFQNRAEVTDVVVSIPRDEVRPLLEEIMMVDRTDKPGLQAIYAHLLGLEHG